MDFRPHSLALYLPLFLRRQDLRDRCLWMRSIDLAKDARVSVFLEEEYYPRGREIVPRPPGKDTDITFCRRSQRYLSTAIFEATSGLFG